MLSAILKSDKFPRDVHAKLNVLIKDISSLLNHTNFSFERLEYLQNTVLGLINLDQNKIMKVLTFVSLLFMPPTLISGIFGMNVGLPIFDSKWDFLFIVGIMLVSVLVASYVFKRHKLF
jgi:magnesium transporter